MANVDLRYISPYTSAFGEYNYPGEAEVRHAALARLALLEKRGAGDISLAIRQLRLEILDHGVTGQDEADALFALERSELSDNPEWSDFFIPVITDYILWQSRPSGVINEAKAMWLLAQADMARTPSSFAILVTVAQEAHRLTPWFTAAVRGRATAGWPGIMDKNS